MAVAATALLFSVAAVLLGMLSAVAVSQDTCQDFSEHERVGCWGSWKWDTREHCIDRGCCWSPANDTGYWCHYPKPKTPITTVHVVQVGVGGDV